MLSSVTPSDSSPNFDTLTPVLAIVGLLYVAILVAMIVAYAKIIGKAGYSPWWVLMMFVPIGNIIVFFMFAFSEWPIQRRLRELEQGGGYGGYPPAPPYPPGGTWSGAPAPAQPSPWAAPPNPGS